MLSSFEKSLLGTLVLVRLGIWVFSYLSDELIDDHDYSSHIMLMDKNQKEMTMVSKLFKCFVRWDALFYVGIAENDYEYLKNHAFFPFYSKFVRYLADTLIRPLHIFRHLDALIVTGIALNFVASLLCVIIFYR